MTFAPERDEDFRRFVEAHWLALVRSAYLILGDHGAAEDLVQQTLATVYRHWERRVSEGAPVAYVRRAMVNHAISNGRRKRVSESLFGGLGRDEGGPADAVAVYATLEFGDGRTLAVEAKQGELSRLPLGQGERALFSLQPHPTVDIGLGPGQPARATEPIEGGALGLVIDARGRPLPFAAGRDERIAQAQAWRRALGIALDDEQPGAQGGVQ